ncbi:MAG TPA: SPOR domain-containing protein [Gammaproteobacteria bacterium]|nr:SPOR domain-containing protein [Gammaproteobacteria bacterium]
MKWLLVILLAGNLVYFGWELDRQTHIDLSQKHRALTVAAGTPGLTLVRELPEPPPARHAGDTTTAAESTSGETDETDSEATRELQEADVMIEENFVNELMTQLPDISVAEISTEAAPGLSMCFTFGPFADYKQSGQLIDWFEQRQVKHEQRLESKDEKQLFWIYLEPQESRDSAMQAMADLESKGIKDLRLIETGNMQNAISLGLFSTQASVNKRLNELKNKGYQPVVIPYRDADAIYWVDVRLQGQQDVLNDMFTGFPARFNSVPVNCGEIALR